MTIPELCKSCKHSRPGIWDRVLTLMFREFESGYLCKRRSNGTTQLCTNERLDYEDWVDTCGKNAKYYEARK
jgi:hypothetical protein